MHVGVLQKFKWEDCMTIQKNTWGYNRNTNLTAGYYTTDELIDDMVIAVRYNHSVTCCVHTNFCT